MMASYRKIESVASIGSTIFGILEVQVPGDSSVVPL